MSSNSLNVPDGYTTIRCDATEELYFPIICRPDKGVYDPIQFAFHCDYPNFWPTVDCEVLLIHDLGLTSERITTIRDRYASLIPKKSGYAADARNDFSTMLPLLCDSNSVPTRQGKGQAHIDKGIITIDLENLDGWRNSSISTVFGGFLTVRLNLDVWWINFLGAKFFPDLNVYLGGVTSNPSDYYTYVDQNAARWKASKAALAAWDCFSQIDFTRAVKAIIQGESSSSHFNKAGRPTYGPPAGFGLMQIDPPRSLDVIWNWKPNIDAGIDVFLFAATRALGDNNDDVKAGHPRYKFEQSLRAIFAYYNGNGTDDYLQWDDASHRYVEHDVKNYAVPAYQRYLAA